MDVLVTDRAQSEVSNQVKQVLRHLCIKGWQSEPRCQHQNFAERRFQDVKGYTNRVLNSTGAPPDTWFLCMQYVIFIVNRTALESLGWRTLLEKLDGATPDISMVYRFKFWDHVYFARDESSGKCFPSKSNEESGRFMGF